MKVAVLFEDTGEMGNRLVTYAHLLAFGAEHRLAVQNLCFWRYAHLFEGVNLWGDGTMRQLFATPAAGKLRGKFTFDGDLVCRPSALLTRAATALASRAGRWSGAERAARLGGFVVRVEDRWNHRCSLLLPREYAGSPVMDEEQLRRHAAHVRSHFRLREPWRARAAEHIQRLRAGCDRLIGIHIRRGDYKVYHGGKWHFDDGVYRRLLERLVSLYPGERVGFMLASNAPVAEEITAGLNTSPGPGHFAVDMQALASCDLIVGPPSTFSGWASFIGKKPVWFLEDAAALPRSPIIGEVWKPRFY